MTRPTESGPVPVPERVLEGLEAVRRSGLTNMLDRSAVARLAVSLGYADAGRWVATHRARYARGVFHGFAAEEDRATVCPCGCGGRNADHDERGWGPWPCPVCRDDSDTDLGQPCSECGAKGAAT